MARLKSERLDLAARSPVAQCDVDAIVTALEEWGGADVAEAALGRQARARHRLSVKGCLAVLLLNGIKKHHRAHWIDSVRILNSLDSAVRARLGMTGWDPAAGTCNYDCFVRLCWRLADFAAIEAQQAQAAGRSPWSSGLLRCTTRQQYFIESAFVVDGTDMPTWALFDFDRLPSEGGSTKKRSRRERDDARRAAGVTFGKDRRAQWSADEDARGGHRSAVNRRNAGMFVGRQLHLIGAAPRIVWTDGVGKVRLGEPGPRVIVDRMLVPAGTYPPSAIVPTLVTLRGEGVGSGEVIADRGYTQGAGGDWHLPLSSVGYDLSMDLKSDQRGERPGFGDARVIDGTPFSKHLPADLVDIRLPSQRDSAEVKAALTRKFDERGRFRYRRHKPPGSDGTTRWKCPFEAGAVRSRDLPWTMRSARTGPLVDVPDGACCRGIETAGAGTLPLYQRTLFGTTAWWKAYKARRQIIESINAELHGQFIDIGHGFVRTLRSNRIDLLLTVSLAGFNWYETRRWELQNHRPGHRGAPSSGPRKPRRDRLPRYEDILGQDPAT